MTKSEITSKMKMHAALAYEAWNNGNFFDYLIEHARFEMAMAQLWKMDVQLNDITKAIDAITEPC